MLHKWYNVLRRGRYLMLTGMRGYQLNYQPKKLHVLESITFSKTEITTFVREHKTNNVFANELCILKLLFNILSRHFNNN